MARSGRPDTTDPVSAVSPGRRQRGFILLTVILATLALTLLGLAALALAMAEHRASEWDRGWIGTATGVSPTGMLAAPEQDSVVSVLGYGFRVFAPRTLGMPGAPAISMHWVGWCVDPALEALGPWGFDPVEPTPPVLGPLGVADLGRLADAVSEHAHPLPPGVTVSGGPVRVLPGPRQGLLLLAEGDIELHGSGTVHAAAIVEGRLRLGPDVHLVGGGRASGLELSTPGAFLPDRVVVEAALEALPVCPVVVHALGRLGRF
jgi:hypothetical protein